MREEIEKEKRKRRRDREESESEPLAGRRASCTRPSAVYAAAWPHTAGDAAAAIREPLSPSPPSLAAQARRGSRRSPRSSLPLALPPKVPMWSSCSGLESPSQQAYPTFARQRQGCTTTSRWRARRTPARTATTCTALLWRAWPLSHNHRGYVQPRCHLFAHDRSTDSPMPRPSSTSTSSEQTRSHSTVCVKSFGQVDTSRQQPMFSFASCTRGGSCSVATRRTSTVLNRPLACPAQG